MTPLDAPHTFPAATDQQTTVLYVLSTLAQTCAALAAFVGAVGIFRLQILRDQRREAKGNLRIVSDRVGTIGHDVTRVPITEVTRGLEEAQRRARMPENPLTATLGPTLVFALRFLS